MGVPIRRAGPVQRVSRRSLTVVAVLASVVVVILVALPRRYEVDGCSMGPGLLPGDVVASGWLPALDRWRGPRRFDRWIVTLPDRSTGLKRVAGLPGEVVSFVAGDLAIDGRTVLKGPRQLAAVGSVVEVVAGPAGDGRTWFRPAMVVRDDAPFATGEVSRQLLAVGDVGLAAVVAVSPAALGRGPVRARSRAGPLAVGWRLHAVGRFAVVVGRLDGHAVAAAWPLPPAADAPLDRRCLPAAAPARWPVARPWPVGTEAGPDGEPVAPALAIDLAAVGDAAVVIERLAVWRDILYRAAADGTTAWRLGTDDVFLLGDFPSGSRDSRHFGPLATSALRHGVP